MSPSRTETGSLVGDQVCPVIVPCRTSRGRSSRRTSRTCRPTRAATTRSAAGEYPGVIKGEVHEQDVLHEGAREVAFLHDDEVAPTGAGPAVQAPHRRRSSSPSGSCSTARSRRDAATRRPGAGRRATTPRRRRSGMRPRVRSDRRHQRREAQGEDDLGLPPNTASCRGKSCCTSSNNSKVCAGERAAPRNAEPGVNQDAGGDDLAHAAHLRRARRSSCRRPATGAAT
jgi:hypothetical protein